MKVLCVHPNYELYGSDRSFAMCIEALSSAWDEASIEVLLPKPGPILTLAPFDRLKPVFRDMWVLRRRDLLRQLILGMPRNVRAMWRALRDMNAADLTYINTIIGIDFLLMARFTRKPVVIHVREIPNGLERKVFRLLLLWSKARLIFNSKATLAAYRLPTGVEAAVVYNGFGDPGETPAPRPCPERKMEILTLGRLNRWKGQELLIDAVALLSKQERERITVRIVGGTFNNQNSFHDRLAARIVDTGLGEVIRIDPFEDDPSASFRRADVVVVPSRLPEPFGRVAIEAMGHSRAVVCSAHGGLTEIVVDDVTGRYFTPSDPTDLARVLRELIADPAKVEAYGAEGRKRYFNMFTQAASNAALLAALARACSLPERVS